MTKYIDPKLSQESLETYQGYSLQVFTSGRIKLSFHKNHKDRIEHGAPFSPSFPNKFNYNSGLNNLSGLLLCLVLYIRPLIFGFSNKVSGTGGRMFNA